MREHHNRYLETDFRLHLFSLQKEGLYLQNCRFRT